MSLPFLSRFSRGEKMHTRLSVTCLFASLLVGLSPNALAIPTKPGGSVTQLFRAKRESQVAFPGTLKAG